MTTRREARDARLATMTFDDAAAPDETASRTKRRAWPWLLGGTLVVLLGVGSWAGITAKSLYDEAMSVKSDLEEALPLVGSVQASLLSGDSVSAQSTAAQISKLTNSAARTASGDHWQSFEWVPVVGANLSAVRIAATSADALVRDAVTPLASVSLDVLRPVDGALDLDSLAALTPIVTKAAETLVTVRTDLDAVDRSELVHQVSNAITKLDNGISKVEPAIEPLQTALAVLPKALGAEGPRNYLLLFQNNAESRGTGGNPAAIAMLTADNGVIALNAQASSSDFKNNRSEPIIPLNPETTALYGDKIGRYVQDVTLSPDFTETATIVRAYWAEAIGTPIDGVASFDPVALSYLLQAVGPVTLPTGEIITADNAVPMLLSDVYSMYPDPEMQDLFFAGAAGAVFSALLQNSPDPRALIDMLAKSADEGRLMYAPDDPAEAAIIAGTKIAGQLPADNTEATVVGAYVNDVTEGKLNYYMQLDVAASCSAPDPSGYTVSATVTNTLTPDQAADLAPYVAPGRFFPKGDISTDLVLYGPVGSVFVSATVDGAPATATPLPHLGRTAVKVNIINQPGVTHNVAATFAKPEGKTGPLEVRHTPMVKPTPVTITQCGG